MQVLGPLVVLALSIESEKLLRNLERGFSKTINWNKLAVKETTIAGNNFDVMIEPMFQRANRLFVLAYVSTVDRESTRRIYMPDLSIRTYNVSIDGRNIFKSPITQEERRGYENLKDIMIGNGDDYTVGSLIDYKYFANFYKINAIDLSKQGVLDADPQLVQQINFSGYFSAGRIKVIFVMEESKDTILNFTQGTV